MEYKHKSGAKRKRKRRNIWESAHYFNLEFEKKASRSP